MKNTTFIIIPGQRTSQSLKYVKKSGWEQVLSGEFPQSRVDVCISSYGAFDKDEVLDAARALKTQIENTEGGVVLFGYCYGGFISRLAYDMLSEAGKQKIKALITMATPHQVPAHRQRKFLESLSYNVHAFLPMPVLAFGGWLDPFAFPLFIKPKGKTVYTKFFLFTFHRSFYFNKKTRTKVVNEIKKFLEAL